MSRRTGRGAAGAVPEAPAVRPHVVAVVVAEPADAVPLVRLEVLARVVVEDEDASRYRRRTKRRERELEGARDELRLAREQHRPVVLAPVGVGLEDGDGLFRVAQEERMLVLVQHLVQLRVGVIERQPEVRKSPPHLPRHRLD